MRVLACVVAFGVIVGPGQGASALGRVVFAPTSAQIIFAQKTVKKATTKIKRRVLPAPSVGGAAAAAKASTAGGCKSRRIMPLGDSLTFGLLPSPSTSNDSYRGYLFRALLKQGFTIDMVGPNNGPLGLGGDPDHAGFGGYTIGPDPGKEYRGFPNNLSMIVGDFVPKANPNVIVLDIGTNDLGGGVFPTEDPQGAAANPSNPAAPNLAPTRLRNLVAKLQSLAPSAAIVIADIPPSNNTDDPSSYKLAVNETARALGEASATDKLFYAPVFQRMMDAGFARGIDLIDNVHMTASGGSKFFDALFPTVLEALAASC